MTLFQKDVLLLSSEKVLLETFGAGVSRDRLQQDVCSRILDVSFSEESAAHRCVVFALPKSADKTVATHAQFAELAFFGDSQYCLDLAIACAKQAEKILVVGTRSRENVSRMTQHYVRRLCSSTMWSNGER
ncbi:hypothetical protein [Undibacterium flavidum]|uniref:Uncharacterized protein n=1 Tax=Undibacterium flavidum TaxID=2762297 RepID=A0ABR6YGT5_9BURK|nr:hypothetical protein [Undibacterium flavidum]MBC3875796.1 hypothetical protein [Undibacterium flavidum]